MDQDIESHAQVIKGDLLDLRRTKPRQLRPQPFATPETQRKNENNVPGSQNRYLLRIPFQQPLECYLELGLPGLGFRRAVAIAVAPN